MPTKIQPEPEFPEIVPTQAPDPAFWDRLSRLYEQLYRFTRQQRCEHCGASHGSDFDHTASLVREEILGEIHALKCGLYNWTPSLAEDKPTPP